MCPLADFSRKCGTLVALNALACWRFGLRDDLAPPSARNFIAVKTTIAVFTAMNSNAQAPMCFEVDVAVPSQASVRLGYTLTRCQGMPLDGVRIASFWYFIDIC